MTLTFDVREFEPDVMLVACPLCGKTAIDMHDNAAGSRVWAHVVNVKPLQSLVGCYLLVPT